MKHDYIDKYSDIDSFLHRRDPRVKIISFVASVVFIVLSNPEAYISFAMYGCLVAILILLSKIPLKHLLKRSISIIPFVLVVAIFINVIVFHSLYNVLSHYFALFRVTNYKNNNTKLYLCQW